jgi:hypothetical protein
VTRRLGITPTSALEAGERPGPRSPVRDVSGWWLDSAPRAKEGVELAGHLHRLLNVLEPAAAELGRLVDDGYWANWFCHVESHAAEHAVELDRATLTRLLRLPGDLWLDVSAEDD